MPVTNKLNDTQCKKAKPEPKPYKLTDGDGMYLYVLPSGAKSWRLNYRIKGIERTLTLGLYPDVPLGRARNKRDDARRLIADGKDPNAERRRERQAGTNTFRLVAEEWLSKQKDIDPKTIKGHRSRLEAYLYPKLGNWPIADITAPDLLSALQRVDARGVFETAHRVRALYDRIERYAVVTGRLDRGIASNMRGALTKVPDNHFAAITNPKRVGQLLRAIAGYQGQPAVEIALKLAPLLFVRPGELRNAEWSEFDLEAARWEIPAGRMKMGRPHLVPLSKQAITLLQQLKMHTGPDGLLFPGLLSKTRPISDNTLNCALRRLGFSQNEMTVHGFRAMARTLLDEELGFRVDIIEHQLAHAVKDANGEAYNRTTHIAERIRLMQQWADYLDRLVADTGSQYIQKLASDSVAEAA